MTDRGAALVTGASRGIGAAVAQRLASLGWPVMLLGRDPEALAAAAKACEEHGNPVQWLAGDLADDGFMREAVARTQAELGTVDVLVNNAGVAVMQPVQKADLAAWRHLMKINYDCAVFLANAVLPSMLERETGAIINISSISGRNTGAGSAAYSASKHALNGFSGCLFEDVREHGVRVSSVMPGFVATDLTQGLGLEESRMIRASDVADCVEFILATSPHCCPTEIVLRPQLSL